MIEKLLLFIENNNPDRWVLIFEGEGVMTLEYFGKDYMGEREVSCGTWQIAFTITSQIETVLNQVVQHLNTEQ